MLVAGAPTGLFSVKERQCVITLVCWFQALIAGCAFSVMYVTPVGYAKKVI